MATYDPSTALGSCCACGQEGPHVRNILQLDQRAPIPGRGWGCSACGLSLDGAVAVVCDACLEAQAPLRWACRGYPAHDGRIPIDQLVGTHHHDPSHHREAVTDRPHHAAQFASAFAKLAERPPMTSSPHARTCPLCTRTTHHPDDVANASCPCCGGPGLPKACQHQHGGDLRPLTTPEATMSTTHKPTDFVLRLTLTLTVPADGPNLVARLEALLDDLDRSGVQWHIGGPTPEELEPMIADMRERLDALPDDDPHKGALLERLDEVAALNNLRRRALPAQP